MDTPNVASVAVAAANYGFDRPYSYVIPEEMDTLRPGCRVIVPFGRGNRPIEGIVLGVRQTEAEGLKSVLKAIDPAPILTERQLRLAMWMHNRFFCTVYDAVRAILPVGVWYRVSKIYRLKKGLSLADALDLCGGDDTRRKIVEMVHANGGVSEADLEDAFADVSLTVPLRTLVQSQILELTAAEKRRVQDRVQKFARLNMPADQLVLEAQTLRRRAPQQASILDLMVTVGRAPVREICSFTGASVQSLNALVKKGFLAVESEPVYRRPTAAHNQTVPLPKLTAAQQQPFEGLRTLLEKKEACAALLFGVTGNGKTTVYLHLMETVLSRGQSSILLVPEIALTPQMIETFSMHFGDTVAVLHSKLSMGARYDEWKRIRDGKAKIIIGTRSAVFAPTEDLGLLILDEEQEETYKSEQSPRYHARDVAKYRCAQHQALLLLGSATPDICSRYHAEVGNYHYFEITGRYNARMLPRVTIVDLKQELRQGNVGSISSVLRREIESNLDQGEQTILFLNRRGASKLVTCSECGYIYECPRCSVSLTYHRANHTLRCHHCGYRTRPDPVCPDCGGELAYVGDGTEQVEQELHSLFPGVEVMRMDADSIAMAGSHETLLTRFRDERVPILIGTQMIAKGLNFEQVTLVGVLLADQSLYAGDFRAGERTFSLVTQVVGRSGRGARPGRAVIQSFTPENQTILQAARQDYPAFYRSEIELRRMHHTPPFSELMTVTVTGADEDAVMDCCFYIREFLRGVCREQDDILGPAPLPVVRVNNRYRYRITVYAASGGETRRAITDIVMHCAKDRQFKNVHVFADVDPYD